VVKYLQRLDPYSISMTVDRLGKNTAVAIKPTVKYKGGPGSGFAGHAGRPGLVGGSTSVSGLPIDIVAAKDIEEFVTGLTEEQQYFHKLSRNIEFFLAPDGVVIGASDESGGNSGHEFISRKLQLSDKYGSMFNKDDLYYGDPETDAIMKGFIRCKYTKKDNGEAILNVEPLRFDTQTLHKLQTAMLTNKSVTEVIVNGFLTNEGKSVQAAYFTRDEFVTANRVTVRRSDDGLVAELKHYKVQSEGGEVVEKQLPIDDTSKANLVRIRTGMFNNEVDALSEKMYTGGISIGAWEEAMKKLIRELHSSVAAIGKGGWDAMTPADWGRLGPVMKSQYQYLHRFAEKIASERDTISIDYIKARAHLYGNAANNTLAMVQAGQVLTEKLPWLPGDGSTECLINCKCRWELEIIGKEGDFNIVQAIWHLGEAEHCDDCVERDEYVVTLNVYKTIPIPAIIGYAEKEFRLKGGKGSGFTTEAGHVGRPGLVGGSSSIFVGVSADKFPVGTKIIEIMDRNQKSGAPIRGDMVISVDDPRIPDLVYHMTTSLSGVKKSAEISARGEGALGGDKQDQLVSMTIDRRIAEQLAADMKFTVDMAKKYANNEPELIWDENTKEWINHDANGNKISRIPYSESILNDLHEQSLKEGWDFPNNNWPDSTTNTYSLGDWYRQYYIMRESRVKINNPIIFTDMKTLAKYDSKNIGVVSIPKNNLRTGALLVDFDLNRMPPYGLQEIRLYGDVPLTNATFKEYVVDV